MINTFEEQDPATAALNDTKEGTRASRASSGDTMELVSEIKADTYKRLKTGLSEFDRVLGGGLVPGGIILIAGPPGSGKSSLTNLAASELSKKGKKVAIVSGEETKGQIRSRLDRINADTTNVYLLSENNLNNVKNQIMSSKPEVLIIDSIQTLVSDTSEGRVGSVAQVTEVAQEMTQMGKRMNIPVILIGHVTKDGNIAGPRVVEHLVDAVLLFEGTRDTSLRLLRGVKNRYGATDEVGCFEHASDGLHEVSDPSGYFLTEHAEGTVGYSTSILIEGNRALPVEIQSLVSPSNLPNPRRVNHGLDNPRVLMIQAIVEKYTRNRLNDKDVYVSTTGGLATKDTSVDLAIAAAIISSLMSIPLPPNSVVFGETTLTGEIRPPRDAAKRFSEAKRLGFTTILSPIAKNFEGNREGITEIGNMQELISAIERVQ